MTEEDLKQCLAVLEAIDEDRGLLAQLDDDARIAFQKLCGKLAAPDIGARRKLVRAMRKKRKQERRDRDEAARDNTGIRELRAAPVLQSALQLPPPVVEDEPVVLEDERKCYVCKSAYKELHHFYDQLCPDCGELNFKKRTRLTQTWRAARRS